MSQPNALLLFIFPVGSIENQSIVQELHCSSIPHRSPTSTTYNISLRCEDILYSRFCSSIRLLEYYISYNVSEYGYDLCATIECKYSHLYHTVLICMHTTFLYITISQRRKRRVNPKPCPVLEVVPDSDE
jgi:hypothetical protein